MSISLFIIGQICQFAKKGVKNQKYEVIGVLEPKGAMLGQSQDNLVFIPITHFLRYFASYWEESLQITLRAKSSELMTHAVDEAIGAMRSIRNVKPWEENDFEIETNEALTEQFAGLTSYLQWFGLISGGIALIAAGVGIMNIMLVSVTERTKEIGIRKAVGAKKSNILTQFLTEAVVLCQIGGIVGIAAGVIAGNLAGSFLEAKAVIPWDWVIMGSLLCVLIGVVFGTYPAYKASTLDLIEALRYE